MYGRVYYRDIFGHSHSSGFIGRIMSSKIGSEAPLPSANRNARALQDSSIKSKELRSPDLRARRTVSPLTPILRDGAVRLLRAARHRFGDRKCPYKKPQQKRPR